jgi:hypothetical protein
MAAKPSRSEQQGKTTPQTVQKWNEFLLDVMFEQADRDGRFLTPDEAICELPERIQAIVGDDYQPKTAIVTALVGPRDRGHLYRKLHHHAVDLFYETYFSRGCGAPKLSDDRLSEILHLHSQGLSYLQIGKQVGEDTSTPLKKDQTRDRIRKQVKKAMSSPPSPGLKPRGGKKG